MMDKHSFGWAGWIHKEIDAERREASALEVRARLLREQTEERWRKAVALSEEAERFIMSKVRIYYSTEGEWWALELAMRDNHTAGKAIDEALAKVAQHATTEEDRERCRHV